MPYTFACPSCGEFLHVAPSLRGQSVNCNFCDHRVTVPARGKSKKSGAEQWAARPFSVFTATTIGLVAIPVISIVCCLGLVSLGTAKKAPHRSTGGFGLGNQDPASQPGSTGGFGLARQDPSSQPGIKPVPKKKDDADRLEREEKQERERQQELREQERREREAERKRLEQEAKEKQRREEKEEIERNQKQEQIDIKREQEELLADAKSRDPQLKNIKVHAPAVAEQPSHGAQTEPVRGRLYWVIGDKMVLVPNAIGGFNNRKKHFHFHVFMVKGVVKAWQPAKGGYDAVNAKDYEIIFISEPSAAPEGAEKTKSR
jgi:hypothetical protein